MKLYDINIHLDQFKSPISILKEYSYFNIKDVITLCDNVKSYDFLNGLYVNGIKIIIGIGLHPNRKYSDSEITEILDLIKTKIKIIGECGLDFIKKINPPKIQYRILFKQLKLAEELNLVVILHVKKAEKEILDILSSFNLKKVVFHWYNGTKQNINKFLKEQFYFSFNKCIIYSKKYHDYISQISLNRLLLESDAPHKFKGDTTKPEDFPKIVKAIAKIKSLDIDFVSNVLSENFKNVFNNDINIVRKNYKKNKFYIDSFI